MAAALSRYFEKADVSIFTGEAQNQASRGGLRQAIQTTLINRQPAMGILVRSTKRSSEAPSGNPGPTPNGWWGRQVGALFTMPRALVLAMAVVFLSAAAVYF